jgi:hypothetical protein
VDYSWWLQHRQRGANKECDLAFSGSWRYPIDGRPGFRLTAFTGTEVTRNLDWSADGRLLLSRGENKMDLVLFRRTAGR